MTVYKLMGIWLVLLPSCAFGQANGFACSSPEMRAEFYDHPNLTFAEITLPNAIKQWKTRPGVPFGGFDTGKYGFTKAEFYRWHVPVKGREGMDQSFNHDSTDRLALAVRVISPRGERWFELAAPEQTAESVLYIQAREDAEPDSNSTGANAQAAKDADEMAGWISIADATPDPRLPIFSLSFHNSDSGVYQVEEYDHQLLLDLRTGTPQIVKALSCSSFEPISGACSAQDEANSAAEHLQCDWDSMAGDFHCTETVPYGGAHAARSAERDFYLLSGKPARIPGAKAGDLVTDVGQLALQIRDTPKRETKGVMVSGLGPTTLLQRFSDLLPGAEVFVFASPGAGMLFNAHLSLVTVSGRKASVEAIGKWSIGAEEADEEKAPEGYAPEDAHDSYHSKLIEQRPNFRAFDAVLKPGGRDESNAVHVVYWIGLEAVNGNLVANAVRLASEDYIYGGCGQDFHESTATLVKKNGAATEATVRVQGPFNTDYTNPYPVEGENCVWTGVLHWKAGAGFRVRKVGENCKAEHQEVKISDAGVIQTPPPPR